MNRYRWILLACATALLLIAGVWSFTDSRRQPEAIASGPLPGPLTIQARPENPASASSSAAATSASDAQDAGSNAPDAESIATPLEVSEPEFEDLQERADVYLEQSGYVDWMTTHPDYLEYDDETLEALAAGGDVLALTWLAVKRTGTDPRQAIELHRKAGVRGSKFSLLQIAQIELMYAKGELTDQGHHKNGGAEQEDPADHLPEAAAWGMVALARGDHTAISFIESLNPREKLTEDELATACRKFGEYYADLATERARLGFEEFDNSPSPLVSSEYAAASICESWPVPMPRCRAISRSGAGVGYTCDQT